MDGLKEPVKVADTDFMRIYEAVILKNTKPDENVLVPHMMAGHFAFELASNERKCLIYDDNPVVRINFESEFFYPSLAGIKARLNEIKIVRNFPESEVKRFLDPQTYDEVMSIRTFLENAPKDAINLWIKRLVSETLKLPNDIVKGLVTPQYYNVKEAALRIYKTIFTNIDPMKILILHDYVPEFFDNESAVDAHLGGAKVKMVYYAPYAFNAESYFEHNLLKAWFVNITKEQLMTVSSNVADESKEKKDFMSLHKKLESAGIMVIEKLPNYNLEPFFKLALFYGYENLAAYKSQKGVEVYIMRKLGALNA